MSTIKSSAENLTLNADGANNDVIIQSNGSTKVTVDGATGNVGVGTAAPAQKVALNSGYVQVGNGIGGAGGVKYPYSSAAADCRNWRTRSDVVGYGDWGIEQSTTQSGETYATKLLVAQAGDVTVNTGNLVIGTAGKGIDFSATSGSGTSEVLDDYEEGTWTPTLSAAGGSGFVYSMQAGTYTKVGNSVHVQGRIITTSIGSASGSMNVDSFPFTPISGDGGWSAATVGHAQGLSITAGVALISYVRNDSAKMTLHKWSSTIGTTALSAAEWSADGGIMFSANYTTAA